MQMMEITSKEVEVSANSISDLKVDASFRKISKNATSFNIWRIDEDRLEAEPRAHFGSFYDDCAYIVYAAGPVGTYIHQDTITREVKQGTTLERFIHFWLGQRVSEQKRSNVAHKIQELDSYFDNVSTEYRETQNNESARFLSYFKRGLTIRSGTLNTTTTERLLQLRGRKWLRCIEMDDIRWEYFCSDYLMLLKTEPYIFLWVGRSSSNGERTDALALATKYQTGSTELIVVDDGYEQALPEKPKKTWNSYLPLKNRIVSQSSGLNEKQHCQKLKIYKCGYKATRLHLDQMDVVIPTKDDLNDSHTAYVLDGQDAGVWLWVGNQVKQQDNISAMGNGRAFVKKKKYPYSTPVIRVVEGHEPIEFTRLFPNWHNEWNESLLSYKPVSTKLGKLDAVTLCERPKMAADTQLIDDGSGVRTIFRITADDIIELPISKVVMFSTNQCFVVQYTVVCPSINQADEQSVGIQSIIYQWNGSEASTTEIKNAERFATGCFEKATDKAMFVQMSEFDETPHFLQIFQGKLVILQSDKNVNNNNNNNINESSSKNNLNNGNKNSVIKNDFDNVLASRDHFILKIYGDATYNSKAVEVFPLSSLSSKECYVIKTSHIWVWSGQSSTGDAREVAKNIGALLGESSLVLEGVEPKEFWRSISSQLKQPLITNGNSYLQSSYKNNTSNGSTSSNGSVNGINLIQNSGGYLQVNSIKTRPQAQLFMVWMQHGKFFSQEIIGYDQNDLSPECVYVLDASIITFVWLGEYACALDKERYMKLAQQYLEIVPIARRPTTAIGIVRQHSEPNIFKGFFENWKHNLWQNFISYEQKRQVYITIDPNYANGKLNGSSSSSSGSSPLPPAVINSHKDFDRHHKYPILTLQQERDLLPNEVNPLKREVHLTHDDFVSLFNMSFWEFDELPGWKKQELKKKHKLF